MRFSRAAAWMLALAALAGVPLRATATSGTPPIFNRMDRDAEARNHEQREAWLAGMHRAAPGVDWRRIEAANTMENFLRRQAGPVTSGSPWTEIGAGNVAGRTHVTVLAPNGRDLYVGTSNGGLWSGGLGGGPWTPRSDGVGAGVHRMVYVAGSPDVIVTATGGGMVYYSSDGGTSWHVPGGLPDVVTHCLRLLHEVGSPRVYLLAEARRWTGSSWDESYQLYRSTNGGMSFTYLRSDPLANRPDIWIDRVSPGRPLYLLVGSRLEKSVDFGASFTRVGTTPVTGESAMLAGSEAGAPTLYAALLSAGVWKLCRSTDAGVSWTYRSDLTDFWETLCASITQADRVFYGGVDSYRSSNGGTSFALVNHWYDYYADPAHRLHADVMGIDAVRLPNPAPEGRGAPAPIALTAPTEAIYFNTDGGTFVTYDLGTTFTNLTQTGLGNAQYYGILTSRRNSRSIAAGSQDQGYQLSTPGDGTPLGFTQIISGDYGHLTSTTGTHDHLWSVYPGFIMLQLAEGSTALEFPDFPPAGSRDWLPSVLADPDDPNRLYFCADHLWRIDRTAPAVYSQTALPQDFARAGGEHLTAFAISPADHATWYAVTNQGALWSSHDAGASWSVSASPGPGSHYFYGTELLPSPTDAATCFVGGSGYSNPAVYHTTNGGATWAPQGTGLPSTLVLGLAFSNATEQTLYAATEAGPYYYDAGLRRWVSLLASSCCAPLTTYWDVEALPHQGVVRFATYGRGIWDFATGSIVGVSAARAAIASGPSLEVRPNPASSHATLAFALREAGNVTLEVFDIAGHRVAVPARGYRSRGAHTAAFDLRATNGRRLESGIYLVRIVSTEGVNVRKLEVGR